MEQRLKSADMLNDGNLSGFEAAASGELDGATSESTMGTNASDGTKAANSRGGTPSPSPSAARGGKRQQTPSPSPSPSPSGRSGSEVSIDGMCLKAVEKAINYQSAKVSNLMVLEAQLEALGKASTIALAVEVKEVRTELAQMQEQVQHVKTYRTMPKTCEPFTIEAVKMLLVEAARVGQKAEQKESEAAGFLNKKPAPLKHQRITPVPKGTP